MKLPIDGNTIAAWLFEETEEYPLLYQDSVAGHNLIGSPTGYVLESYPLGHARRSSTGYWYLSASGDEATAAALLGDYTIDMVARANPSNGVTQTLVSYGAAGESLATNYLVIFGIDSAANTFRSHTEYGSSGLDTIFNFKYIGKVFDYRYHLITFRKRLDGTTYSYDLFIDGALEDTVTGVRNAEGGASGFWQVGNTDSGTHWRGGIGGIRVSNIARSDEEVLNTYKYALCSPYLNSAGVTIGITDGGMGMFGRVVKNARTTTATVMRRSVVPGSAVSKVVSGGSAGGFNGGFN